MHFAAAAAAAGTAAGTAAGDHRRRTLLLLTALNGLKRLFRVDQTLTFQLILLVSFSWPHLSIVH